MKSFVFLLLVMFSVTIQAQTAYDIVKKADNKLRGNSSLAEMTIRTVRPTWSREMSVKAWVKGEQQALILILAPVKEKGITYLKKKNEVWNWIPKLERVIKLPPSMMSQSWMGTDFTNDDLVKESSMSEDYVHRFLNDTMIAGKPCFQIQSLPKPNSAVVWGMVKVCIDKYDFMELYAEFYDEEGQLINMMKASDVQLMDGRLLPSKLEMIPADKKGQKTVIIYKSILFDRPMPDDIFSLESMKRIN